MQKLPLLRVIDLRTETEKQLSPDVQMENVVFENVSIIRATTFGITYEKSSGGEIAEMLKAGMLRMQARGETYDLHMEILYQRFVEDEHCRNGYGQFLRLLANNPLDGATLWHCTAGKDRVGTCTALLLHCLGASYGQILQDYLLTNEQSRESKNSVLNKVKDFVSPDNLAIIDKMLSASTLYLESFYAKAEEQFGGIDGFIAACGVTQSDIQKLRKNYLL